LYAFHFISNVFFSSERLMIATILLLIFSRGHACQALFQHSTWAPSMLVASAYSLELALVRFSGFIFSIVHVLQYTPHDVTPLTTALQRLRYKGLWLPNGGSNWIWYGFVGLGLFLLNGVVQKLGAVGR
jgi:hypothetical protein